MNEIAQRLQNMLNNANKEQDNFIQFPDPSYKAIPFSSENFRSLSKSLNTCSIAFIDGGIAEIFASAHVSLQFVRLCCCIYNGKKKVAQEKSEFFTLVHTNKKGDELFYDVTLIDCDLTLPSFSINSMEESMRQGLHRVSISSIGSIVRKCAEIAFAEKILEKLSSEDIILMDGTLAASNLYEKNQFDLLFQKAIQKNIAISALSKTSQLLTDKGNSVAMALNSFDNDYAWLYSPVATIESEMHVAEMSFVKLHSQSDYVFRMEIYKNQANQIQRVAEMLAAQSNDPIFLGYPYGLVDVDNHARISNQEKDMRAMQLRAHLGKDWKLAQNAQSSTNAHSILDSIPY